MSAMQDQAAVVKAGELYFKPKTHLIKKFKKHKACLFQQSSNGVARLEIYENHKDYLTGKYSVLIPGSEVVSVRESPPSSDCKYGFILATKDQQHNFGAENKDDQNKWIKDTSTILLQLYSKGAQAQAVNSSIGVMEENDIYEPADDFLREFKVTAGYETRQKVGMDDREVRLVVENGHITIITHQGVKVARWGLEHLRRFGYKDTDFHFEAGRKSEYGEGFFTFISSQGKQIHTLVTREKKKTRRSKEDEFGQRPVMSPGQISGSFDNDDIPFSTGGHIYEEVIIRNAAPDKKKPAPDKPVRLSQPKMIQVLPAAESNAAGSHSSSSRPQASGMQSPTLANMPKVKSLPTGTAIGPPKMPFQNAKNALKNISVPGAVPSVGSYIYCEVEHIIDAWKTHGRDDETPTEEAQYATLQFTTKQVMNPGHKDEAINENARRPVEQLVTQRTSNQTEDQQQENVVGELRSEPIYAVISKPKKESTKL